MDSYWQDYLDDFVNEPFYWFQPKGFTVSRANLGIIRRKLEALVPYVGRPWKRAQPSYAGALQRAGLFAPRRAKRGKRDYPAIVRMNKEVFDSLGLAWINDRSIVELTSAGRRFLQTRLRDLPGFVGEQLLRYELPNPAVGRQYDGAGVFPYPALLGVLSHFPHGVPTQCYELFMARMRCPEDTEATVERIQRFLELSGTEKRALIAEFDKYPILRDGRIVVRGRRTSLYNTIRLNRSYMLSFLRTPGLVEEQEGRIRITPELWSEAVQIARRHSMECRYYREQYSFYTLGRRNSGRSPRFCCDKCQKHSAPISMCPATQVPAQVAGPWSH